MSCRQCRGIEGFFTRKLAARELKGYRKRNAPAKVSRALIEALKAEGVEGSSLLDIGGGIGVIQHELLQAGASNAINVEASAGYLEAAREEAARRGNADRVAYHHGDFVELAPDIPQADVVTLDRVICCYPDMATLVGLSAARAGSLYGLVYPRDTRLVKLGASVVNLVMRLRRSSFRVFVHPTEAVDRVVSENGLKRRLHRRVWYGVPWQVVLYARAGA